MDPIQTEASFREINAVEQLWGLPPLPEAAKLDLATIGSPGSVRAFLYGLAPQINRAITRYDSPSTEPLGVYGGDPATGPMARGITPQAAIPGLKSVNRPGMPYQFGSGPDTISRWGQVGAGVLGASVVPGFSQYDNTFNLNQSLPYMKDPDSVRRLKEIGVEMGLLPKNARIDERWDPSMNVLLSDMAKEDFNRSMTGERPGAISVGKIMTTLGDAVSPDFALSTVTSLVKEFASGFWWDMGGIREQWQDNWSNYRQTFAEGADSTLWEKAGAIGKVIFGVADDVVMPVMNWALMAAGVGEVALAGRVALGLGKFAEAAQAMKGAEYFKAIAASDDVTGALQGMNWFDKIWRRGFNEAITISDLNRQIKAGKLAGKMGTTAKVEAWRSMKGTMLMRKASQQMLRSTQAQMLMSGIGNNPADFIIEDARARSDEWRRENLAQTGLIAVMASLAQPRYIYQSSGFLVPRTTAKVMVNQQVRNQHALWQSYVEAMRATFAETDPARAANLDAALKTGGPMKAAQHGLFGNLSDTAEASDRTAQMMLEAVVNAGLDHQVKETLTAMAKPDWTAEQWRRNGEIIRRKLIHQVTEWDPERFDTFDGYLRDLQARAVDAGQTKQAEALEREIGLWGAASPETQRREFGKWAVSANDSRNTFFQQLVAPILNDPNRFIEYLQREPLWLDANAFASHRAALGDVEHWVSGTGGFGIAGESATPGQVLGSLTYDEGVTAKTLAAYQADPDNPIPSISEMMAPGQDDISGLRASQGLDEANEKLLDTGLEMVITGQIPRSSLLGSPGLANVLNRTIDAPNMGNFAVAKLGTLTGNEAQLFIDQVHGVIDMLETLRRVNADPQMLRLAQGIGRSRKIGKVDLGGLERADFRSWALARLGGRSSLSTQMGALLGDPVSTNKLRNLSAFLQKSGVDLSDLKLVEESLDRRVRSMMGNEGVWRELGVGDEFFGRQFKDIADTGKKMLGQARGYAKTFAQDVHDVPQELKDLLAMAPGGGYKVVYGKDFYNIGAIGDSLGLSDKLPNLAAHGDVGTTALAVFMPDRWAQSRLFSSLADKAGRFTTFFLNPGEKGMISLYEKVLKENIAHRLNDEYQNRGIRLAGSTAETWDRYSDEVADIYQGMWDTVQRHKYNQQRTYNDLTGFGLPHKVSMAFTPQTLRDAAPKRILENLHGGAFATNNPDLVGAMRQALRDSLDLSSTGRYDEAMRTRGPLLFMEDFIRSYGATRGLLVGLPMLAGSALSKTMFDASKELTRFQRAARAGGLAAGLQALNETLGTAQGEPFSLSDVMLQGLGAAAGGALGGGPLTTAVGALGAGVATQEEGNVNPLAVGLGALGGAAISSNRFRDMQAGWWRDGRTQESSTISKIAGGFLGGELGEQTQESLSPDMEAPLGKAAGVALGAVLGGPLASRLAPPVMSPRKNGSAFWRAVSDFGRFQDQTLSNKAFNTTLALRFTLSPLFDIQRHIELATFAMVKDLELPAGAVTSTGKVVQAGQTARIPLVPKSRPKFIADHGRAEWDHWAGRFDNAAKSVNRGHDMGYDAAETSVKYFMSQGILGFNPTAKGISIFRELADQGMGDTQAYTAAREILAYGVNGRTTGELTINAIFFPFSFQARYVGRWAKWLTDDVMRATLVTEGIRTYDALSEKYNLDDFFEKHIPLIDQLRKINALSYGISPGEFGGIHRPWIEFFIPVATMAVKGLGETFSFWNPYDATSREVLSAAGAGISKAAEQNIVDGWGLAKRIIPMWRDAMYLVEDLKEQNHVIFSPRHMTPQAESSAAATSWRALQDSAERVAKAEGFRDLAAYSRSTRGAWLAKDMAARKLTLMERYPRWEDALEQSIAIGVASRFTLRQIAENPQYPVDYDVRAFMDWLDTVEQDYLVNGQPLYDFDDPSSLPTDVQDMVRDQALRLAGNGRGFDKIWDKYFRRQWGPINRPVYLSVDTSQQVGV